jgi:hypothetical protein
MRRTSIEPKGSKATRNVERLSSLSVDNLMKRPEFTRSTTLRWTALVAGIFAAFIIALLGFVYLKTKDDLTMRSDRVIVSQIGFFAYLSPERRLDAIDDYLKQDPGGVRVAGLFGPDGRRIAGNLEIEDRQYSTKRRGRSGGREWPGETAGPPDRAKVARRGRADDRTKCR